MKTDEELERLNELVVDLLDRTERLEKYVMYDGDDEEDGDEVKVEIIDMDDNPRASSFLEGILSRMSGSDEDHECYHAQMLREQGSRFKSILDGRDKEIARLQLVVETLEEYIKELENDEKDRV